MLFFSEVKCFLPVFLHLNFYFFHFTPLPPSRHASIVCMWMNSISFSTYFHSLVEWKFDLDLNVCEWRRSSIWSLPSQGRVKFEFPCLNIVLFLYSFLRTWYWLRVAQRQHFLFSFLGSVIPGNGDPGRSFFSYYTSLNVWWAVDSYKFGCF